MSRVSEEKKKLKKQMVKTNRIQRELLQFLRLRDIEEERLDALEAARKPKRSPEKEEWEDKVASIRNRLNGKKRISRERWNRFAGTGDEGGRGL